MKVFVSWSGQLSREVALELRAWVPLLLPSIQLWVSTEDIRKGGCWSPEVAEACRRSDAGIICITADNLGAAWLNFEAGALSALPSSAVWTLLLDGVPPNMLSATPLGQFQATEFSETDFRRLLREMNGKSGERARAEDQIDTLYPGLWPKMREKVHSYTAARDARGRELSLSALIDGGVSLVGETFTEKTLKGPAIAYMVNCSMEDCYLEYDRTPESILWETDPVSRPWITGAILVSGCRFVRCRFEGIGFTGNKETIAWLRAQLANTAHE